jgi:putative membrane protein
LEGAKAAGTGRKALGRTSAAAHSGGEEMSAVMWDNDYGWGAWLAMSVGMVAFWAIVVVVVVAVVRSLRDDSPPGDQASRLLDERFARGDIDEHEYRTRRELLRSGQSGPLPHPPPVTSAATM